MKKQLYSIAAAALAAALPVVTACSRGPSRPSVLLIVEQGVRADHQSVYGYPRGTTPRAEALSHEGAVFENAYTSTPDPMAALASLLTGRYPPEHGLLLSRGLSPNAETLAEVLKSAGYVTRAVVSTPGVTRESGLLQGFDEIEAVDPAAGEELDGGAAQVTTRAVEWVRNTWDRKQPFLLLLIYSSPQLPYRAPEAFRYRFMDPAASRARVEPMAELWIPFARRFNAREVDLSALDIEALVDLYDAEVAYADDQAGGVVLALRESGLLDRTLVVVTSDRGEDLGEQHRLADPSSLREPNLRIPLLMRLPGRVPAGLRVASLAQDVDVMPTILDLLEVPKPEALSALSVSQYPLEGAARRSVAVSLALGASPGGRVALLLSVRDARYRFTVSPQRPMGLYDISQDPSGALDILASSAPAAAALQRSLREWDGALRPLPGAAPLMPPGAPGAAAAGGMEGRTGPPGAPPAAPSTPRSPSAPGGGTRP